MFVNVFALNSFEDVESKTFVLRLSVVSVELRCPQLPSSFAAHRPLRRRTAGSPQRLDGFPGESRLRPNAAAPGGGQRPRRGCGVAAEQRRRGGRQGQIWPGPQIREACARHRGLELGALQNVFFLKF